MQLDASLLALLGLLTAAIHWLVARSAIARPLWSRATGWVDQLLRCVGCCAWWLGLALGAAGLRPVYSGWGRVADVLAAGLAAVAVAPVAEALILWGLGMSAMPSGEDGDAGPR